MVIIDCADAFSETKYGNRYLHLLTTIISVSTCTRFPEAFPLEEDLLPGHCEGFDQIRYKI